MKYGVQNMIDLTVHPQQLERAIQRARENRIVIPTFAEMRDPSLIPEVIKKQLSHRPLGCEPAELVPHHLA